MIEITRIDNEEPLLKVVYIDTDSVKEVSKDDYYRHYVIDKNIMDCEYHDLDFELFLTKYQLKSDYRSGKIDLKEWWKYRQYLFKKYVERVVSYE